MRKLLASVVLLGATVALSGCLVVHQPPSYGHAKHEAHHPGPPPHAPAHGYRTQHGHGPELVFDSRLGVYAVVGRSGHYYHAGHWYRRAGDGWQLSVALEGPWRAVAVQRLPVGLALVDEGHGHPHGHHGHGKKPKLKSAKGMKPGHGNGAAKGDFDW